MDKQTQTEVEAAVFRRLVEHLDANKDVQNIDLMILADFCRNCLANGIRRLQASRALISTTKLHAKWYTKCRIQSGKRSTSFQLLMSSWRNVGC